MAVQQMFDFPEPKSVRRPERVDPSTRTISGSPRDRILRDLRAKVGCITTSPDEDSAIPTFSTGSTAIDRLLPRGGLRWDSITEWVCESGASSTAALSLITAASYLHSPANSLTRGGPLVVVCGADEFYPPAAMALGIPAERIIWIRPTRHADAVWSIDQALRSESVAAVWACLGISLDDRDARRFQLACETGRTPGLFVRPKATRGRPSFADVRFHVRLAPRSTKRVLTPFPALRVTLDRCRGARGGDGVWVQIDDQARVHPITIGSEIQSDGDHETAAVRLACQLAHPKTPLPAVADQRRA